MLLFIRFLVSIKVQGTGCSLQGSVSEFRQNHWQKCFNRTWPQPLTSNQQVQLRLAIQETLLQKSTFSFPDSSSLSRYVKTTANATVDHLSKYLALRIALEDRRTDGEPEDRAREEAGGEERGETEGASKSGEGSGLNNVSEKQYTIYIMTRGGQFSVSVQTAICRSSVTSVQILFILFIFLVLYPLLPSLLLLCLMTLLLFHFYFFILFLLFLFLCWFKLDFFFYLGDISLSEWSINILKYEYIN